MRLDTSATATDDKNTWLYAFTILLIVSLAILGIRFLLGPFLATDFEIVVIYLPTILAGLITFYLRVKTRDA
jgi:hypothetical protein